MEFFTPPSSPVPIITTITQFKPQQTQAPAGLNCIVQLTLCTTPLGIFFFFSFKKTPRPRRRQEAVIPCITAHVDLGLCSILTHNLISVKFELNISHNYEGDSILVNGWIIDAVDGLGTLSASDMPDLTLGSLFKGSVDYLAFILASQA